MKGISELWQTVVLRDILGYIVPGMVTLFAAALLFTGAGLTTPHVLIDMVVDFGALSEMQWQPWHPWLVVAVVVPLSFVVGHLQGELIAFLGQHSVPPWNLGALALKFLAEDAKVGGEYGKAALEALGGMYGKVNSQDPCTQRGGRFGELICRLDQSARKSADREDTQKTEEQARDLWYLCNYYVLDKDPGIHATWLGRYYVLTILLSNLFLSAVFLAIALVPLLCHPESWAVVHSLEVASSAPPHAEVVIAQGFLLVAAGIFLVCSWRFKQAYVERTFPIFYVLSRPTSHTYHRLGRRVPEGGTAIRGRAAILTAILAGTLGYWLRGRGVGGY
ncbi:MAG TPA: hypothetical protein VMW79_02375 [Anaerolineae bacterium]|nr:hypothetical protein [Anaerolineae bacterium]